MRLGSCFLLGPEVQNGNSEKLTNRVCTCVCKSMEMGSAF